MLQGGSRDLLGIQHGNRRIQIDRGGATEGGDHDFFEFICGDRIAG